MDSILVKFQNLHHLFFILRKLVEGDSLHSALPENLSNHTDVTNTSSQGGFLRQPVFDASMLNFGKQSSKVNSKLLQQFSCLLSNAAWPSILRLLVEGKGFLDYSYCQVCPFYMLQDVTGYLFILFVACNIMSFIPPSKPNVLVVFYSSSFSTCFYYFFIF